MTGISHITQSAFGAQVPEGPSQHIAEYDITSYIELICSALTHSTQPKAGFLQRIALYRMARTVVDQYTMYIFTRGAQPVS